MSLRRLLTTLSAISIAVSLGAAPAGAAARFAPSQWVDPLIGTEPGDSDFGTGGGGGNVVPAPMVPFGMTQFGPRTEDPSTSGGYDHRSTTISGFPLTALSGAGCQDFNDFPLMPTIGIPSASPETNLASYRSPFSHADETVQAGYYGVKLQKPDTKVELTAARRANLARFTFPETKDATILVRSSVDSGGAQAASFAIEGKHTIQGTVDDGGFCGSDSKYRVHFTAVFDHAFRRHGTWTGNELRTSWIHASGKRSGAYVTFDTRDGEPVLAKVAISYVSRAGSEANLEADAPDFDFDAMRAAARRAWDERLGRIRVGGGTTTQKRIFYTALYHALVVPNVFSDADGRYTGFDNQVHRADGWTQYANFSGWDVYRSWFPLLAMVAPRVASDFAQSLVVDGEQAGAMPKWSPANDESSVMVGDPASASVASAFAFGARRFDTASALRLMVKAATQPGVKSNRYLIRPGLANYLAKGYIPLGDPDGPWGPPSTTLEYGSADYAISAFARALGNTDVADRMERQSQNWQNLFNPGTGFVQPRTMAGNFADPFDPASADNYVEGNAWQYTWLVPHNAAGLIAALGGEQAAAEKLDRYFTKLNAGPNAPYAFMGNEPSFSDAWLYNWVGEPWKTQEIARRTTVELFRDEPGGLVGNDDLGASSGWHVWGAIGLYPQIPGVGGLTVGSPLFPKVTIRMPGGRQLKLRAPDAAVGNPYVQRLKLDGRPIERTWLRWNRLARGATLRFNLGPRPTRWAEDFRPPSFQEGQLPALGYLDKTAVFLKPGGTATIKVGVQNLSGEPVDVTYDADLPAGVTLEPAGGSISAPAGGRQEETLTLKASEDAEDGAKPVDLRLRTTDGITLPPTVVRVAVARPGDLVPYFDTVGTSRDDHSGEGNFDGGGFSYSTDALAKEGVTPGATINADGFAYAWPDVAPGQPDDITAHGQVLELAPASGKTALGFLGAAGNGPSKGTGTITYTDGTKQTFTLGMTDWAIGGSGTEPDFGNTIVVTTPYRNSAGNDPQPLKVYLFTASVALQAGKTVASVTLPDDTDQGTIHVFAIAQK